MGLSKLSLQLLPWAGAVPGLGADPESPKLRPEQDLLQPKMKPLEAGKQLCALNTKQGDGHRQKKNETAVNKNIFLSYEPSP